MQIKSFAKVNIFLKIVGTRENYHEIESRFMVVENLYDILSFEKKEIINNKFEIDGNFSCNIEQNTIYKVYNNLLTNTNSNKLKDFFRNYKVSVDKKIPEFAGLGGGSSNAASFLLLLNDILNLNLSKDDLAKIGAKIGADIPFFIYRYKSANVLGIGEIVKSFDEEPLKLEIITPKIKCDTKMVYQKFRKDFLKDIDINSAHKLLKMKSVDILYNYKADELNDLLEPAISICDDLKKYKKEGWYFSGSGSSFFSWVKQ